MKIRYIILVMVWSVTLEAQIRPTYKVNTNLITKSPNKKPIEMCSTGDFDIQLTTTAMYNAIVTMPNVIWENGKTLKVAFISVDDQPKSSNRAIVESKVRKYAQEWEKYANIDIVFTTNSSSADIRIGMDTTGGWWSKIGTNAKNFTGQTMNYGWNEDDIEDGLITEARYKRVILHEFGHALGLKHEHQNPSAGICWDWDAAFEYYEDKNGWDKDKTKGNLEALSSTGIGNSTTYDPESIMIYSIDEKVTDCGYSVEKNDELSTWDKIGIANLYPKRGERHFIGPYISNYNWTAGWDNVLTYQQQATTFLFLLKSGTGDVHIHRMNSNGSVGQKVFDKKWSSGWTTATIFKRGTQQFLFLLKKGTGDVHIHKINSNGTVGTRIYDKKWTSGWTNAEVFSTTAGKNFLFLLKSGTGDVHIHKINTDGTVSTRIYDRKWTSGWTVTKTFQTDFKDYLFLLKTGSGNVKIFKLNDNGTIGPNVYDKKWTTGWSTAEFYGFNNQAYVFLMKAHNGHIKLNYITASGTLGDNIFDNKAKYSADWTSAKFYRILTKNHYDNYLFLLRKKDGEVHINKIYSN